jgi:hypothetical protein
MATGTYFKNIQWVIQESLTISMIYTFSLINVTYKRYFYVSICRFITDFYLSAYNKRFVDIQSLDREEGK